MFWHHNHGLIVSALLDNQSLLPTIIILVEEGEGFFDTVYLTEIYSISGPLLKVLNQTSFRLAS